MVEFNKKVSGIMSFLLHKLPQDTYWSPDMMKLLVYMADQKSIEKGRPSISGLNWEVRVNSWGDSIIEARGYEGMGHWEDTVDKPTLWERLVKTIFPSSWKVYGLSPEELVILKEVVETKQSEDYNIGSLAFRQMVIETYCDIAPKNKEKMNVGICPQSLQIIPQDRNDISKTPLLFNPSEESGEITAI